MHNPLLPFTFPRPLSFSSVPVFFSIGEVSYLSLIGLDVGKDAENQDMIEFVAS